MSLFSHLQLGLFGLAIAFATPVHADDLDTATQQALQGVIGQQLAAFAQGDASAAESFASPGIKARFPDPAQFLGMVQSAYAPLVAPRSTRPIKAEKTESGASQTLSVVDRNGDVWTALYTFELTDGQWRISGCLLVKDNATAV